MNFNETHGKDYFLFYEQASDSTSKKNQSICVYPKSVIIYSPGRHVSPSPCILAL